jgi:hypothetical protein
MLIIMFQTRPGTANGTPAFGGKRCVGDGEKQRRDHCCQHAQSRAQRILRQVTGSSETVGSCSAESGAKVSRAPLAASSRSPKTKGKATKSHRFGIRPRAVRRALPIAVPCTRAASFEPRTRSTRHCK